MNNEIVGYNLPEVNMEERIKERFNEQVLEQVIQRYGLQPSQVELLDGFESFMYAFERSGKRGILRIGHSLRRSLALIRGEVDWINYLAAGGAGVARALYSPQGNLVENIPDGRGENFLVTAFQYAPGHPPGRDDWNARLFERYGAVLGRMHRLSMDYAPTCTDCERFHWDSPELDEIGHIPPSQTSIREMYSALKRYLNRLPRDRTSYGLIHQDAHGGNFFVDDAGQITLFDFEYCAYSWYVNDIAIVFFYALMYPENPDQIRSFVIPFFQGYRRENQLDPGWVKEIPYFLKLREVNLYGVIYRRFDVTNITDPWVSRFMEGRQERLEAAQPYHDFDYGKLENVLKD